MLLTSSWPFNTDRIRSRDLSTTAEENSDSKKTKEVRSEFDRPEATEHQSHQTAETNDWADANLTFYHRTINSRTEHHHFDPYHGNNHHHGDNHEVHLEVPEMVCYRKYNPGTAKINF